jgi:DNA (cytosine-5)-methyltransferase 1
MPSLFGIKYSNRDFSLRDTWGKNQFNSTFPVALVAYLESLGLESVYLTLGILFVL